MAQAARLQVTGHGSGHLFQPGDLVYRRLQFFGLLNKSRDKIVANIGLWPDWFLGHIVDVEFLFAVLGLGGPALGRADTRQNPLP